MTRILPAVAASAALVLAGCGGSSSSSSSSNFTSEANAICAQFGAQINALPAPSNTGAAAAASLDSQIPIEQAELAKLKALTPPSAQAADWRTAISNLEQTIALSPQLSAAAKAGDAAQVQALVAKAKPLTDQATSIANKLGLTKCAANYQPGGSSTQTQTS